MLLSASTLTSSAITITHDISSMRDIADRVIMLRDAGVAWSGKLSEIDQADEPQLQQFLAYGGAA